ncbi:MAG TPA: hypothetical protein VME41_18650 [Stellaceae bacterium]|nr:hypothetical protein [Stellaceae bacterium]
MAAAAYGAIALGVLIATGSAASAQHYRNMQEPRDYNVSHVMTGGYNSYRSVGWNGYVYGTHGPDGGHPNYGRFSAAVAREQLNAKGYSNVRGLEREHGWSAQAVKNGRSVHVVLDDNDSVATYRGK